MEKRRCRLFLGLVLVLVGASSVSVHGRSITSLEAPRGCKWRREETTEPENTETGGTDRQILSCRLRTIANAAPLIGNLSTVQTDTVTSLGLECNDEPSHESQFDQPGPHDFLAPLSRLESLGIEFCKIRYLPGGAFASAANLRKLKLSTRNDDWSSTTLEVNRDALRGLPNLRELNLADNNVWNLPSELLCPVRGLTMLNLTRNKLQDVVTLGFSDWGSTCTPNLEILDLSFNELGKIPDRSFGALRGLAKLMLQNNDVRHVGDHAFAGLTNLRSLNISSNRLVALPPELFVDTTELVELIISNNSLTVLATGLLDPLEKLQSLDLSGNKLTSGWVNGETLMRLVRLVILDLSFNALTRIDAFVFKWLYSLQMLKLEHNDIDFLADGCFASLLNLHSLTLSHNKIVRFEPAQSAGLGGLVQLFFDSNMLRNLHPHAFVNASGLQDLSISGNLLTEVPEALRELTTLKTLDLGNNRISQIERESFVGLDQLYGLRLVDNKLENVSRDAFSALPALQVLNLASNTIRYVEQSAFASNPVLRAIRLDGNELTEIRGALTSLTTLAWLNVSDNKLLWFDYSYLPNSLEWLDMHNNQISVLANYHMVQNNLRIEMLDASYNLIEEISDSSIPDSVQTLYLNNNKIRTVAPGTFMKKENLKKVDLHGNEIRHLEITALGIQTVPEEKEIPSFYIGDNPIICDCSMEWLPKINEVSRHRQHPRIMDLESVTCEMVHTRATPHRPLLSLEPKDFLCRYENHCYPVCHCCKRDDCECEMTCPDNCSCYHDHSWTSNVVDCSNSGHNRVPDRIPVDATEIYLDGNQLGDLDSHSFVGKRRLEVLYLNASGIVALHNRTFSEALALRVLHLEGNSLRELRGYEFDQLERLSELYLDHNAIAMVGNTTFNKMTSLEVLRLDSNRIVDFRPWEALAGTGAGARVALEGNAWNCDCTNTARLRAWLTVHNGDAEKMYCRDGTETLAEALRRCRDRTDEAITREIPDTPLMGGNLVPLLAGALVAVIVVCLVIALAFAFRQDVRLWAHSRYGLRLGKMTPPPDEERDRLYDGYIIYSERDDDFVSRCLSAELEQTGLALCLHWRDLSPSRAQEALPPAAAAARRILLVFSPVFLANEWQHPEFRAALRCAIENIRLGSRRRRVVILLAAEAPLRDAELQLLLQTCTVIVWGEKRFWEKLRFAMPDSLDKRRKDSCKKVSNNDRCAGGAVRVPARYTAAPSAADLWSNPNGVLVAPVHAPTPTPTQSTYVSSASSRTEDEDSGAEHQHLAGYGAYHGANGRPASLASRGSHLYSTIPEPPLSAMNPVVGTGMPINPRTYFV